MGQKVIQSAEDFVSLRTSDERISYRKSVEEDASLAVWKDVINRFPEMKKWVAFNKTIPIEIIKILSEDVDPEVRIALAMKRSLPFGIFEILSKDLCEGVRERLSYNKKCPSDILELLSKGNSDLVRRAALQSLGR